MRYSYEFKRKCIEMYRDGVYPETPEGIKTRNFRKTIREWSRIEEACGPKALKHKSRNKEWTAEERYELVARALAGESINSVAISAGINAGLLRAWMHKYEDLGYNGLENMRKGRPLKEPKMKKSKYKKPRKLNESEYEELVRLRAETEYLKAENAVIKKEIALREKKEAARLKAKKRRSSKNSEKKDTD
jgi:transposase